jgi:hypothetical protein
LDEKEHKLASVLTVASSLLGGKSRSSPSEPTGSRPATSMEIGKQLMLGNREQPQAATATFQAPVERISFIAVRWSILLAVAAVGMALAACTLQGGVTLA